MDMSLLIGSNSLVTGGAGFLGSHLIQKLLEYGSKVVSIDINDIEVAGNRIKDCKYKKLNLCDKEKVSDFVIDFNPDYIFHLAADVNRTRSFELVHESVNVNILGTVNLLNALKSVPYRGFVFASTSEVYGGNTIPPFHEEMIPKPHSPYSVTKLSAEYFCSNFSQLYGKHIAILRFFNIIGGGQGDHMFVPQLISACLLGGVFEMTEGNQEREFCYVDDVVDAIILASLKSSLRGEVINIGTGIPYKLKNIAEKIKESTKSEINILYGALPYRIEEETVVYSDINKAKILLNWQPKYDLESALLKTIVNFKNDH